MEPPSASQAPEVFGSTTDTGQETAVDPKASNRASTSSSQSEDRRSRLRTARLQRSSFTEEASSAMRRGVRKADQEEDRRRVKMGVRVELPGGHAHHIDSYDVMHVRNEVERRQLMLGAAQIFQWWAMLAKQRQNQQELLRTMWEASSVEKHLLRRAARVLERRRSAAAEKTQAMVERCTDLASEWLVHAKDDTEEVKDLCERMATDVGIYQQEMLHLQILLPQASQPCHRAALSDATPTELLAGFMLEKRLAEARCPQLQKALQQPQTAKLEEKMESQEDTPRPEIDDTKEEEMRDLEERLKAAMELLDAHQPQPVKATWQQRFSKGR
ncbi:unnamed protein product [Durusdinium trenchii]|uniref:Uncharacterized protein n=1 Tax=Durusdinium trenchii TaxID=1381693 RepID=A0ABP0KAA5_9DINO